MTDYEKVERLEEIKEQFEGLLEECRDIVRGTHEEDAARSYWIAHIECALSDDHGYLGGSVHPLQSTIEALGFPSCKVCGEQCEAKGDTLCIGCCVCPECGEDDCNGEPCAKCKEAQKEEGAS